MKALRAYYEKNFRNIKIKEFIIDEGNKDKIERIINSISEKNIIINLTGGKRINSLILLDISNKNKIPSIYIDIKMKMIYEFKESIIASNKNFEDLEIDDIVKASGGKIVEESSELCNKKDLIYFAEQISKNLELWHEYKQQL